MSNFDWTKIDEGWKDSTSAEKGGGDRFEPIPDGPYTVVIDKAEFRESKAGNPYLNMILIVNSGEHEGRWLFKRNMLSSAQNMSFLKKDLAVCGVEIPERISGLDLESLLDRKLRVTKKTKGDFENIYFDQLLENFSAAPKTTNPPPLEDVIPF